MPQIIAYSGIAKQDVLLKTGSTSLVTSGASVQTSYTMTIPVSGRVQYFSALMNVHANAGGGSVDFIIKRNGEEQSHITLLNSTFVTETGGQGIMFIENLSFLAGCVVSQGETFEFRIDQSGSSGIIEHDDIMILGILAEPKTFIA